MRERPIIFSGEMVRAILDGRKTQTRRVVKPQPQDRVWPSGRVDRGICMSEGRPYLLNHADDGVHDAEYLLRKSQPYGAGDRLWVKETFCFESTYDGCHPVNPDGRPIKSEMIDYGDGEEYEERLMPHYRATEPDVELCYENADPARPNCRACEDGDPHCHWRPSIFMPRWASRITLEVTEVRVQRLQEISPDDVRAEGICLPRTELFPDVNTGSKLRQRFEWLWDSLNKKKHPWSSNPWVWAITFKEAQ